MPTMKIARSTIDRLVPVGSKPVYYYDALLPGFGVRVSPKGVRTFVVQGYGGGKTQRRTLGRYPRLPLEDARQAAQTFLKALTDTGAPLVRVKVADALDQWLAEHGPKLKPRTLSDYHVIVSKILKPTLGPAAVDRVTRADVVAIHKARVDTPRRANYVIAVARAFFTWTEDAGHRPPGTNPAKRIAPYPENRRERFLSEAEIGRAAAAIDASEADGEISRFAAAALRLILLTGARQGEIAGLRWTEVDFERRMIRLADSKTGKKPIWLSEPALDVLRTLPRMDSNPHVFPGDLPGGHYKNLRRAWIKARRRAGLADVRLHDLRHTFASAGAAAGLSLPLIGALLGHTVPATTQRYAHLAASPVASANELVGSRVAAAMKAGSSASDGSVDSTPSDKP